MSQFAVLVVFLNDFEPIDLAVSAGKEAVHCHVIEYADLSHNKKSPPIGGPCFIDLVSFPAFAPFSSARPSVLRPSSRRQLSSARPSSASASALRLPQPLREPLSSERLSSRRLSARPAP